MRKNTESIKRYLAVAQDSGTSEGAKKGWEKRKHGGYSDADRKTYSDFMGKSFSRLHEPDFHTEESIHDMMSRAGVDKSKYWISQKSPAHRFEVSVAPDVSYDLLDRADQNGTFEGLANMSEGFPDDGSRHEIEFYRDVANRNYDPAEWMRIGEPHPWNRKNI